MDISVLIPTYNRNDLLTKTLDSLCALKTGSLQWEVILIDNAADGATWKLAETYRKRLSLIYLIEPRQGKSHALNTGLKVARGEWLIFTDDDISCQDDWLTELWKGARRFRQHHIFGGAVTPLGPGGKSLLYLESRLCRLFYGMTDTSTAEGPCSPYKVYGANMMIRRDILRNLTRRKSLSPPGSVFDTRLGPKGSDYLTGCETDLLLKLEKDGHVPVFLPQARVNHQIREEQTTNEWLEHRAFLSGRSMVFQDGHEDLPRLLGIPRYLWRLYAETGLKWALSRLGSDKLRQFDNRINLWMVKGRMYQYKLKEFRHE